MITSKVYPDGRKNADWIVEFENYFTSEEISFIIHGDGWDKVITHLNEAGFDVEYHRDTGDYQADYQKLNDHCQ